MNRSSQCGQLKELLGLDTIPIGIAFVDQEPVGVSRVPSPAPAGCSYWKSADEGYVFYTAASDHYDCPIGAWTHHVELPPDRMKELDALIEKMVGLGYLHQEEVPSIPRREKAFRFSVYGPLDKLSDEPDIVLIRGNARQLMLLMEAAQAAGAAGETAPSGRPTCAVIPLALESGKMAVSFACIGNRIYTGAADGEAYCAIPIKQLDAVVAKLKTVVHANRELEAFHRSRLVGWA